MNNVIPSEVFPPGEYLRDELEERGWTEKDFAEILGRPVQAVSEILNGRKQIVADTALAIADALETSAEVWLNLQSMFNLHQARTSRTGATDVTRRSRLRSMAPIAELRRRGWLTDTDDPNQLESSLMDLLGVQDLQAEPQFVAAARRSNAARQFTVQQKVWIAQVRRLAEQRKAAPFSTKAACDLAGDLVHQIHDPTDLRMLDTKLADVGVILITLLPLKSSKLDGVTTILDDGTPVIGLTSRFDRMDSYLFTLFHELAHLCLGHLEACSVCVDEDIANISDLTGIEAEADRRAADWILPADAELPEGRLTMASVHLTARKYRIPSCLVIGRMQRVHDDWGLLRQAIPRVRPYVTLES